MDVGDMRYFKENSGYRRIFKGILDKYRSLGRMGGSVTLRSLTDNERSVLGSHLRRDYSKKDWATFSVKAFEESLADTRFGKYSLEEILGWYFGKGVMSKAQEESLFLKERDSFFRSFLSEYKDGSAGFWLENIIDGSGIGIRRIMAAYSKDKEELGNKIQWVASALKTLDLNRAKRGREGEKANFRLPVLASVITRDPHAFDRGTLGGDLLVDALCTVYNLNPPSNNQDIAEILLKGGILVDEVSNFVTVAGLVAYKGGKAHPVWTSALSQGEMLQIPLANLVNIERIESPVKRVYVVENPAVFSAILDNFGVGDIPPLICSYGQLKLSGLLVLDKLANEGADIFYSGDFDPEGLLIANKLAQRYWGNFHLWCYDLEDYRSIFSNQIISQRRLSILNNVNLPALQEVKAEMLKTKKAGYQELLIHKLLKSI